MAIIFPSGPTDGQIYTDTVSNRQFVYSLAAQRWSNNGGYYKASLVKPLDPENGELYYDSATDSCEVYVAGTTNAWEPVVLQSNNPDYLYDKVSFLLQSSTGFTNVGPLGSTNGYTVTNSSTALNAPAAGGLFGSTTSFDFSTVSSSKITLGNTNSLLSPDVRSSFTIEMWINPLPNLASERGIFVLGAANANNYRAQASLPLNTNKPRFYLETVTGSSITLNSSANVTSNAWNHLAFVKKQKSYYIFLNGEVVAYEELSTNLNWSAAPRGDLLVGVSRSGSSTTDYFKGYMEDIRFTYFPRYTGTFAPPTNLSSLILL